jgi:hypothetical protein
MMALELLDTNWAGVIQPDPAPPATELARLLEDVGFAEIACFCDLDGARSRA